MGLIGQSPEDNGSGVSQVMYLCKFPRAELYDSLEGFNWSFLYFVFFSKLEDSARSALLQSPFIGFSEGCRLWEIVLLCSLISY